MVKSIQSSDNLVDFLKKRLFRLLPALIVCGLITTVVENAFPTVLPQNLHSFTDYIKNILFLPFLNIPSKLIGLFVTDFNTIKLVDGSYWSLVVEFKFYYLLSILYFIVRKRYDFILLICCAILAILMKCALVFKFPISSLIVDFTEYLPYFIIGIGINIAHFTDRGKGILLVALSLAMIVLMDLAGIQAPSLPLNLNAFIATLLSIFWIYRLKSLNIVNLVLSRLFSLLAFIGRISYPLYLLHQEMGLLLIKMLSEHIEPALSKLIVSGFLVFLAVIINKYFENILHAKKFIHKSNIKISL
jgi:peptidoglycan/LPS O-acetylase OafA/YrhL